MLHLNEIIAVRGRRALDALVRRRRRLRVRLRQFGLRLRVPHHQVHQRRRVQLQRVRLDEQLFFADANLGTRVLSPVEYVVGAARSLCLFDPAPSTLALADWSL